MSLNDSIARWKPRLRKLPGFGLALFLYRLLKGTESRNATLLLMRPPKGLYQPYGTTSYDRYPEIFQFVRTHLGDDSGLRILSLGCSTGEEVFSLRRYFPEAILKGIDINPYNIAVCRFRRPKADDKKTLFAVAGSTANEPDASYDAIFAMAIFRHGDLNRTPPPPRCDHCIRFADFEQSVLDMRRVLKPEGLLIIQHAMFRLTDTSAASDFMPVLSEPCDGQEPIYSATNTILSNVRSTDVVFRKTTEQSIQGDMRQP